MLVLFKIGFFWNLLFVGSLFSVVQCSNKIFVICFVHGAHSGLNDRSLVLVLALIITVYQFITLIQNKGQCLSNTCSSQFSLSVVRPHVLEWRRVKVFVKKWKEVLVCGLVWMLNTSCTFTKTFFSWLPYYWDIQYDVLRTSRHWVSCWVVDNVGNSCRYHMKLSVGSLTHLVQTLAGNAFLVEECTVTVGLSRSQMRFEMIMLMTHLKRLSLTRFARVRCLIK